MSSFEVSHRRKEEIARRCREIDERTVELITGEDVLKEAAAELPKPPTGIIKPNGNRRNADQR